MFTAAYPASFLPEKNGKGFHVRFPDLPEALPGGQSAACSCVSSRSRAAAKYQLPRS